MGRCGDVGSVDGDGCFEDADGFGEVGCVGDDEGVVLVAASGHADVQAAAGRGCCGEGDAAVGGVALGAVFGGGVGELDVLADVVGGEGDGAVSVESGHGDLAVRVGVGDGPAFSVADGFAGGGAESSVVAAGGDDVADHRPVVVDLDERVLVEFAGFDAALLDVVVDGVDVFVAGGRDRDRLAVVAASGPGVGDRVEVVVERAGSDAAEGVVEVECFGVALAEAE